MSNEKMRDSSKFASKSGSKLAWAPNEKTSESRLDNYEPEKKHKPHNSFLFFGHERVKTHKNIPSSDPWNNEKEKAQKQQDPFTKKASSGIVKKADDSAPKLSFCGKILQMWADDDSVLRLSWSTLALIIFSLVVAGIFYAIEHNSGPPCNWTYWESLWFVNTIFTTIGYGTVYPCTAGGKVGAVVCALFGILLNVIALGDVGKLLTRLLHRLWVYIQRFFRLCKKCCSKKPKNAVKLVNENNLGEPTSLDVPLSFALLVTFLWFILSAMFFHFSEPDNMTIGDAFYFVMISVTTIGFGDVAPKKYQYVVIQFMFIIVGIALFSMVYNIIQDKLNGLSDSVEDLISKEYMQAQQDGKILAGGDEKSAREYIRGVIKKQKGGGLLSLVMGKNAENRLVQDYLEKSKKRLVGTQTDNIVHDVSISAFPEMVNVYVEALPHMSMNCVDRGTQLKWMPTTLNNGADWLTPSRMRKSSQDWLNLMHSNRNSKSKQIPRSISRSRKTTSK